MPRKKNYDRAAVDALIARSDGVVKRADLVLLGVPDSTLTNLTGPRGRWQRILPGVVLAHRGNPTLLERRRAALTYAGPDSRLSGHHALDVWGALGRRVDVGREILVVVPHPRHRVSSGFCVVERSERGTGRAERGGLRVTGVARALGDACRRQDLSLDDVREVMSTVLAADRCTLRQLDAVIRHGPTQRSGHSRVALEELGAATRSAAEGRAFRVVSRSGLPQPVWNEPVVVAGRWIGNADAYWPDLGVVLEIDSMTWHLGAQALRRTQAKARRYAAAGLILLSIAPADLLGDPTAFLDQLRRTLETAAAAKRSGR